MTATLLDALLAGHRLLCRHCRSATLGVADGAVACRACGGRFPLRNGVLDLFNAYADEGPPPAVEVPDDVVRLLLAKLDLADTPATRARITDIYRDSYRRTATPNLTAEINLVEERFGHLTDFQHLPPPHPDANRAPRVRVDRHYFEETVPPGATIHRNVRFTNAGDSPLSSRNDPPLLVSYHWRQPTGQVVVFDGLRTRLPIDLEPGCSLTLPLVVRTPDEAGRYVLEVRFVREGVAWCEEAGCDVRLTVRPVAPSPWTALFTDTNEARDYAADHTVGRDMLRQYLDSLPADRKLLLEVGSAVHPQTAFFADCDLLAVDISLPLLEYGALYFGERFQDKLLFACCDALDVPLAAASLDGVVLFSALHHFAAPERLLGRLATLTRPGGFIALMCEPVGTSLEHEETLSELRRGLNEQVFTREEYLRMFAGAGLAPVAGRLDAGSLKAILRPV